MFCQTHNIFTEAQHGFRRGRSTETALTSFVHDILTSFDERKFTVALFLDLSKAFDTVDHHISLKKLEHYGIMGLSNKWLNSYVNNCKQYVQYTNISSSTLNVSSGVPPGSILGPLLFLLYVNDMITCSSLLKFILFADDCTIYESHPDNVNYK